LQLLKVFSDKHLKNKENMQPAEPISIVPEYAFVQPPEKKSSKKELGRRQSNKKKSEQRRSSKSKKDIEKPPRSLEVQRLKEHIHGLDRKIRQSRDKLLSVSKKML
jgi:guanylate kinase